MKGLNDCCRYAGSICDPNNRCTNACDGTCNLNGNVYDKGTIATGTYKCPDALNLISHPNQKGLVTNAQTVQTECDPTQRLKCCQADPSVNSTICGDFWGKNPDHKCDNIMLTYCNLYPTDPLCNCINSTIPAPECADKTCKNTNAMQITNMLNNSCTGNYMFCQQYINLDPAAKNNVIQKNVIEQNCNLNVGSTAAAATATTSKFNLMRVVIIAAISVIGVSVIGGILTSKPRTVTRSVNTRPVVRTQTVPQRNVPIKVVSSASTPVVSRPPVKISGNQTPVVLKRYIIKKN
jgi:hypothetical protein